MLTPTALDSFTHGDVFLEEITTAIDSGKRIIPIIFGGFSFPRNLPTKLDVLKELQASTQVSEKIRYDAILKLMTKTKAVERAFYKLTAFTYLENRQKVESMHTLQERMSGKIKSISLCALACQGMLNANRAYLETVLEENPECKIRVVMLNPDSGAAEEAARYKICSATVETGKNNLKGREYND